MTLTDPLRALAGLVALVLSLGMLRVYIGDLNWAHRDRRPAIRVLAWAQIGRELLRLSKIVLLSLATMGVILRDSGDAFWSAAHWQGFVNDCQTIALVLFSVTTLFEWFTRQVLNILEPIRREDRDAEQPL